MGKIHQLYTALAASYGMFLFGLLYVWPSYTASLFTHANTTLLSAPMTPVETSLIGSLPSLGGMLGVFLCGKIVNYLGRRKGGFVIFLPFLLSWIIVYVTKSAIVIMIARFIGGCSSGASMVYGPIFISEVAEVSLRGFLASGPIFLYTFGTLTSYLCGWLLTYHNILWAYMVFSFAGLIIIAMAKESPVWLLRQKREAEACIAYAYYRGVSPESNILLQEMSRLKAQIIPPVELTSFNDENTTIDAAEKEKLKNDLEITEQKKQKSVFKLIFITPSTRRAFIVTGAALTTQIFMGLIAVLVYAKYVFSEAVPSLSPHFCSVMLAATLLLGTLASAVCTDTFGRRILLITSTVSVVLCLISIGLLIQTKVLPPWITAVLILVYCFALKFGAGNLPYVLLAEVFIPEVQSTAAMILVECAWFLSFIQLLIFPFMIKYLGIHGTFYSFAIFGVIDALVAIFLLPETKGLTNAQIQEAFLRKW